MIVDWLIIIIYVISAWAGSEIAHTVLYIIKYDVREFQVIEECVLHKSKQQNLLLSCYLITTSGAFVRSVRSLEDTPLS